MDIKGKKVVFLGDSITHGACASSNDNKYHQIIAKYFELEYAKNYGLSGTRIARQTQASSDATFDQDFNMRAEKVLQEDADMVFVFGGTNDFGHGDAPFGNINDTNVYTFYGALNTLFTNLKNKFGQDNVIVLTPMHRIGEDNPRGEGNKPYPMGVLSNYVDIIIEVAKKHGLRIINLYDMDILNPNIECNKKYFADGLHPNDAGHKLLADVIIKSILELK